MSDAFRRLAGGIGSEEEGEGWVLYGYDKDGADASKCVVAATGTGAASLLAALREDQVGRSFEACLAGAMALTDQYAQVLIDAQPPRPPPP